MKKFLVLLLLSSAPLVHAQTLVAPGRIAPSPTNGQVLSTQGGLTLWTNPASLAGVVRADQYAGADFCVKLLAANTYAVANHSFLVDATHFTGTQQCSVNPFGGITATYTTVSLTVLLPAAWIQTSASWVIENSGIHVIGLGQNVTWVDYVGAPAPAVISLFGISLKNYVESTEISEMSILGNNANVTDGVYCTYCHRWSMKDVDVWGVTGAGVHTFFSVTPTFYRVHTSNQDAADYGWATGRSIPTNEFTLDGMPGQQTTDGTVIDAMAEGLSGAGWNLLNAAQMSFSGGTSEGNLNGIYIASASGYNTFTGSDVEANTANAAGVDVNDGGASDYFVNLTSTSACTSCNTVIQSKFWGFVSGGYIPSGVSGAGASQFVYGYQWSATQTFGLGFNSYGTAFFQHNVGGLTPANPGGASGESGLMIAQNFSTQQGEVDYFNTAHVANQPNGHCWYDWTGTGWGVDACLTDAGVFTPKVVSAATGYQVGGSFGTSGQCLTSTGTGSSWQACAAGAGITLTTTGTSGAATLSGTTLNIPVYASSSGGTSENAVTSTTTALSPTATLNTVTLAGNYTFTLAAGTAGATTCLDFVQGTTAYTVTGPSNMVGLFTVGTTASKHNQQCFTYSTSLALWTANSTGVVNF